ncbi:uncharacterized protein LOC143354257 [Halictus rubicundus]|uniref:uncharacterized protein LOC143354257 n=1 Tax=Halictus rubicundus TaxID=77578 RepID=UPI004035BE55
MPTLRWTTTVLTTIGCRYPSSWTSNTKIFLYKVYGITVLFLVQSVTLSTILDIVFNVRNQDEFGDNLYLTVPMVISCCKLCSFLANRESILMLMHTMREKPYLPADDHEMEIETRYDAINERISTLYTMSTELCILSRWVTSLMKDPQDRMLPFRAWLPYNYSSPILYGVTYAHQAVTVTIASLMNNAYDSLFSGLLFCIYSQLEILGHRLKQVKDHSELARECARQHNFIYRFATKVNEDFQVVLCVQFMASMTIICFTLYRITQTDLGSRLVETVMYAFCMLMQIFYYCWYGNEVRLKSLEIPDLIFASNWVNLDGNTRKTLLMIMLRSTFPIEFSSAHIVSVNLESFMAVLKTSYSAYSVLHAAASTKTEARIALKEQGYISNYNYPMAIARAADNYGNDIVATQGTKLSSKNHYACYSVQSVLNYQLWMLRQTVVDEQVRGQSTKSTMPTLRWTSMVLTVIGCRQPCAWTSGIKKTLYKAYVCLVLFLAQSLMMSNQIDFGENLYMSAPMAIACCKLCTLLANSDSITVLMTATRQKPYLPMDDVEMHIETKFDTINERLSTFYTVSIEVFMLLTWANSLFKDTKNKVLAYRTWIPYDYSTLVLYSITYSHQAVSLIICSLVNVAFDCLFSGLIFCISSQLDILGHRLRNVKNDTVSARDCARHHNFIYAFAMKMNEDFRAVLFVQFFGSTAIICFSLFRITQSEIGERMFEIVFYALIFLMQLFFYCWYGNEVKLKSLEIADLIFASNWTGMSTNTKKTLLMIMLRATFPIEFTSCYVVSVNLESFMSVIKTSYSTYNLLQES